jgi:hypothetical protein
MRGEGFRVGGHLGASVSALVDGQIDPATAERAWLHVMGCVRCRRLVEQEGWVKRRLAESGPAGPPAHLLGSLVGLDPRAADDAAAAPVPALVGDRSPRPVEERYAREVDASWAAVTAIESRGRGRRRAGLAAVGVGSVSAAVLGISALGGATLGIGPGAGAGPNGTPAASLSRSTSTPTPVGATGAARPGTATAPVATQQFLGWSPTIPQRTGPRVVMVAERR